MNKIFERTSSTWVRYSDYEWKEAENGMLYLTPTKTAQPELYDPLADYQCIVIDAVNIGMLKFNKRPDKEIQDEIRKFALKYGLLGLMTALPTTPTFMDYEAVYLPKNHFIKEETLSTCDYLKYFFPFDKPDISKRGVESVWNITNDMSMIALAAMTPDIMPTAVSMSFQRNYAEPYEWLKQDFTDLTFSSLAVKFYYDGSAADMGRSLLQQGISAFGANVPAYHIELREDKPEIVWDFHSLILEIQMMFSLMLTDSENPIRFCKHCKKAFAAGRPNAVFCSPQCKNKFNVYKSRGKKDE